MSLYEILGVSKKATSQEIKTAFRALALRHHPDKCDSSEHFIKIKDAYDILSDETKRKIYDSNTSWTLNIKHKVNDVILNMFIFAMHPLPIICSLHVHFHEIYNRKYKKLDIKVKRWCGNTYQFATESIIVSLLSLKKKHVFRERGDDPVFMISGIRGDVIIDIIVVGQHNNVKIDEVFSSLDLFCCIDLSLHDYYLCKVLNIPLGFDVNLQIENDRKTSFIIENKGLPISSHLRSDVYVTINVVYPTDLKVEEDQALKDILETYFK